MKERDYFDLVAYTVHRIDLTVRRFILAESVDEQKQAMKWANAWTQMVRRGPKRRSRNRPKPPAGPNGGTL
jgi:hypothetical protein